MLAIRHTARLFSQSRNFACKKQSNVSKQIQLSQILNRWLYKTLGAEKYFVGKRKRGQS